MVGTPGSAADRFWLPTASACSLPARTSGVCVEISEKMLSTWPATASTTAGPPPLYGTWVSFRPAVCQNSSADKCAMLPAPGVA